MAGPSWDDYWKKFRGEREFSFDIKLNRWVLLSIIIIVGALAISYLGMKTGSYIRILEENTTLLLKSLTECKNEVQSLTDSLNTCNNNLESKSTALETCQVERKTLQNSLDSCRNDLDEWKERYDSLEVDYKACQSDVDDWKDKYNECDDDLDACKDDLSDYKNRYNTCSNDLSTLKQKFAKCYCCEHLNTTIVYYKIEDNTIFCSQTNTTGYAEVNCSTMSCNTL